MCELMYLVYMTELSAGFATGDVSQVGIHPHWRMVEFAPMMRSQSLTGEERRRQFERFYSGDV